MGCCVGTRDVDTGGHGTRTRVEVVLHSCSPCLPCAEEPPRHSQATGNPHLSPWYHQQLGEKPVFFYSLCMTLIPAACGPGLRLDED